MTEKGVSTFIQCETCGEYNGITDASTLSWPSGKPWTGEVSVTCLCRGLPCLNCKTRLVHRPATNSYDSGSNSIRHWPHFGGEMLCQECRIRGASETERRPIDVEAPLSLNADIMDLVRTVGMKEAAKVGAKFVEVLSDQGTRFEVELYGRQFGPMGESELIWFLVALAAKPSQLDDYHAEASQRSSEIQA